MKGRSGYVYRAVRVWKRKGIRLLREKAALELEIENLGHRGVRNYVADLSDLFVTGTFLSEMCACVFTCE